MAIFGYPYHFECEIQLKTSDVGGVTRLQVDSKDKEINSFNNMRYQKIGRTLNATYYV